MTICDSRIGRICKYSELSYASLLLYSVLCVESPLKKKRSVTWTVYLLMLHIPWLLYTVSKILHSY